MKKLQFLLSSSESEVDSNAASKAENGMKNFNSKPRTYKFPFALSNTSSSRKWFMGEIKCLQRATRKDFLYIGSFQEAVGSILAMAQCFGLMPVVGIKSKSAAELQFKWNSIRTIYSVITFLLAFAYACITLLMIVKNNKFHFDQLPAFIFFGSTVYGMFCFGILATKWPKLMQQWESIELKMPNYCTQKEKRALAYQIKMLALVVLISSIVEHTLGMISIAHFSKNCLHQENPLEEILRVQLSQLLTIIPYSGWIGLIGKFINSITTFTWNYIDLFVMIISVGLSSRFKQINVELQRVKGKNMTKDHWAQRRMQYRELSRLCIIVDDAISQITMLSFSNNLFFICVQLLHSIRPMVSTPHAVYFWFSLFFLISRTLAVSLYSAQIHDESKKPIRVLRAVPSESWCIEVRRFAEQVDNDTIALSGMRFFYLTRKLILSVAGSILTYELVLIQFHSGDYQPVDCHES